MRRAGAAFAVAILLSAGSACTGEVGPTLSGIRAPELVEFGRIAVGDERVLDIEVENLSNRTVSIIYVRGGENFSGPNHVFRIARAPTFLVAGELARLQVGFMPLGFPLEGVESSFTITTDAGETTVAVRGSASFHITIEPEILSFGHVIRGGFAELSFTVENHGSSPFPVTTALGSDGQPVLQNRRGGGKFELIPAPLASGELAGAAPLGPFAAFTQIVRYTPDPNGDPNIIEDRASLILRTCGLPTCDFEIALTGRPTNRGLTCAPTEVDFGVIVADAYPARVVECVADSAVEVTAVNILGDGSFDVDTSLPLPASLDAGETLSLTFHVIGPREPAPPFIIADALVESRVPSGDRELDPIVIHLSAVLGSGQLSVSPSALSFGNVAVGTSLFKALRLENTSATDLTINGVVFDGAPGPFSVTAGAFVIRAGGYYEIAVYFSPQLPAANAAATLVVHSSDPAAPSISIPLSGTGVEVPGTCEYMIRPPTDFGAVHVLHTVERDVWIDNIGLGECLIHSVELTPPNNVFPMFSLVAPADPTAELLLAAGESVPFTVAFHPPNLNSGRAMLSFYISSPLDSQPIVTLDGWAIDESILVAPEELDFGTLDPLCAGASRTVRIYNERDQPVLIDGVELWQAEPVFELPGKFASSIAIDALSSVEVTLSYRPPPRSDPTRYTGQLRLRESGYTVPVIVALAGRSAGTPVTVERFLQNGASGADVLFVVDNSGSTTTIQQELATSFSAFLSSAPANYRVAVVSTDNDPTVDGCASPATANRPGPYAQGQCGYFANGSELMRNVAWTVITGGEQPSPVEVFSTNVFLGESGSGLERGLESAWRALSPTLLMGWNAGFIRPEASLAVVYVSDEDDSSAGEVQKYLDGLVLFKGYRRRNRVHTFSITGECLNAAPAPRYIELATRSGGEVSSICGDLPVIMDAIGRAASGYRSSFVLANPAEPSSVAVAVDGSRVEAVSAGGQVNWTYDEPAQAVRFTPLAVPPPGADIRIIYESGCP